MTCGMGHDLMNSFWGLESRMRVVMYEESLGYLYLANVACSECCVFVLHYTCQTPNWKLQIFDPFFPTLFHMNNIGNQL